MARTPNGTTQGDANDARRQHDAYVREQQRRDDEQRERDAQRRGK